MSFNYSYTLKFRNNLLLCPLDSIIDSILLLFTIESILLAIESILLLSTIESILLAIESTLL